MPEDEQHLVPFAKEDKFDGSFNCLFIDTGAQRILIDAGNGVETDGDGRLFQHLQTLNIAPESIDIVVLTHAHADHILGIDDLRRFNAVMGSPIDVYGEANVLDRLRVMFQYIFDC